MHCAPVCTRPFPLGNLLEGFTLLLSLLSQKFKHIRDRATKGRHRQRNPPGKSCAAKQARAHAPTPPLVPQDVDFRLLRVLGAADKTPQDVPTTRVFSAPSLHDHHRPNIATTHSWLLIDLATWESQYAFDDLQRRIESTIRLRPADTRNCAVAPAAAASDNANLDHPLSATQRATTIATSSISMAIAQ